MKCQFTFDKLYSILLERELFDEKYWDTYFAILLDFDTF